jgi:inorganic pyrophosphatase
MEKYPKNTLHPWYGISAGDSAPNVVTTYIEIVPGDTVKYEIDKPSGLLKIDRPQKFSNICPTPYGFIPQTYCGERVAAYCMQKTGITNMQGDGDPLDICILTEKIIPHGNILLQAIPIGGLRMIDHGEADDKIIAVMKDDAVYGGYKNIADCPPQLIERLKHYFLTYKLKPGEAATNVAITHVYNREEAAKVIEESMEDYAGLVAAG